MGSSKEPSIGYELGPRSDKKKAIKEYKITIRNIGNGFANTLVIHTGFNIGGLAYNKVISVGDSEYLSLMIDPNALKVGIDFGLQYIDAMRNEYIQTYIISEKYGQMEIECGYPRFLVQY